MSYVTSPYAPRARRAAVNLVLKEGWSAAAVARHVGVHRSTIGRWLRKAQYLHGRTYIYNLSSRPHTSPRALDREIISQIVWLRRISGRCALVIWLQLRQLGISVSLSSVERTLRRKGLLKPRSKWVRHRLATPRPRTLQPGDLVQMDTVHFVWPDGRRGYLYTVIDTWSRWAYAEYRDQIRPGVAADVLLRAWAQAGFRFQVVQTDHGLEFSSQFKARLQAQGIAHRHSRLRRPNDNAHIERFNRTIQEECFGGLRPRAADAAQKLTSWLRYYNTQRLHLGIMATPEEIVAKVVR